LTSEKWIIDATPDFREQIDTLNRLHPSPVSHLADGILLTHAHMGHYTGLIHLGPESMDAKGIPVYAMPRMIEFLQRNGPWDHLIRWKNIEIHPLHDGRSFRLNDRITVIPFQVPHRGRYSETVGYRIDGPNASALYIPDIDNWDRLDVSITGLVSRVSVAYLDGTFFDEGEIPGREMADIPHPLIAESIDRFRTLSDTDRSQVHFIHLNHTNPVLFPGSHARHRVETAGLKVAEEGELFSL
jgi:pyrroloquinoline quinone biosynthesis protein B